MKRLKSLALVVCFGLVALFLASCIVADAYYLVKPDLKPSEKQIANAYNQTQLRKSTASDVLPLMYTPEATSELFSQSTKVLAVQGSKNKGYKMWFTLIAFDEDDLLAKRKYLMIEDEKPKILFTEPWEGMRFDCQMILEGDILDEPYSDENARRIAILKYVRQMTSDDIVEVKGDNKVFEVCGGMANQGIRSAILDLEDSPALAVRLSDEKGLAFTHISFGRGKIQMLIEDNIVTVKMMLGSFTKKWKSIEEPDTPPEQ